MSNNFLKFSLLIILFFGGINLANALELNSPDFANNNFIPKQFTCNGANQPPTLQWQTIPNGTQSFALLVSDLDAPAGVWYHWLLFNIPADAKQLTPNDKTLLAKINIGQNSWRHDSYEGPCPPKGQLHRYIFTLYALDIPLQLPDDIQAVDLLLAMQNHVLASATLQGRYHH